MFVNKLVRVNPLKLSRQTSRNCQTTTSVTTKPIPFWGKIYAAIIGIGCLAGAGYGMKVAKYDAEMLKAHVTLLEMEKSEFIWKASVFALSDVMIYAALGGGFAAFFPITIPATIVYGKFYESK